MSFNPNISMLLKTRRYVLLLLSKLLLACKRRFSIIFTKMMYLSKKMLFMLLCWISVIVTTSANYCEWGYCAPSEYCCGDNECCKDQKATWILIGGLLTALVVASVCCACLYRHFEYYRLRMRWPFSTNELLIPQTKA